MSRNYYYFIVYPQDLPDPGWLKKGNEHPYLREGFLTDLEVLCITKVMNGAAREFRCEALGPAIGNLKKLQYNYWGSTEKFTIKFYDYNKPPKSKKLPIVEPKGFREFDACRDCERIEAYDDGTGVCWLYFGFKIGDIDRAICDDFNEKDE